MDRHPVRNVLMLALMAVLAVTTAAMAAPADQQVAEPQLKVELDTGQPIDEVTKLAAALPDAPNNEAVGNVLVDNTVVSADQPQVQIDTGQPVDNVEVPSATATADATAQEPATTPVVTQPASTNSASEVPTVETLDG